MQDRYTELWTAITDAEDRCGESFMSDPNGTQVVDPVQIPSVGEFWIEDDECYVDGKIVDLDEIPEDTFNRLLNYFETCETVDTIKPFSQYEDNLQEVSDALTTQALVKSIEKFRDSEGFNKEKASRHAEKFFQAISSRLEKYNYKDSECKIELLCVPQHYAEPHTVAFEIVVSLSKSTQFKHIHTLVIEYNIDDNKLTKKENTGMLTHLSEEAFAAYKRAYRLITKLAVDFAKLNANEHAGKYTTGKGDYFNKIGDAMKASVQNGNKDKVTRVPEKNITLGELKEMIFNVLCEHYQDKYRKALLKEDQEKDSNMVYGKVNEGEGTVLPDATDQILSKYPTLKHALVRLMTDQYTEFVAGIDWISPKPSEFRINLKNGQNFTMKWMGKDFEANISGKSYYLGQLTDFQQALSKLSLLYQEGPMGQDEEASAEEGGEGGSDFGSAGGGGDFPGGEGGSAEGGETGAEGGEEASAEGGEEGQDMGDENIDFEADDSI